jgi:TPR repeat protein
MQNHHSKKLKTWAFLLFLSFSSIAVANQQKSITTISNCLSQGDPTTCLLRMSQQRLNSIKNPDKKAEAMASIIWAYADTKKENPELFKSGWDLYTNSHEKISASNKLDLYTSLVVYLASTDAKVGQKALPDLYNLYKKIRSNKKYEDQVAAVNWACNLFGVDEKAWQLLKVIYIQECTNNNLSDLEPPDNIEIFLLEIIKFSKNVGWSNKEYVEEKFPALWKYNLELLELADSKNIKDAKNSLYATSAMIKILEADSIVRFKNYSAAKTAIDDAYVFFGKIDTSSSDGLNYSISARIQHIKYLSEWGRINAALKAIGEIEGIVQSSISKRPSGSAEEVTYLAHYAHLKYLDRNLDLAEKLNIEKKQGLRQADVLYTAYKIYDSSKSKSTNDPEQPELNLLIEAANAGHPLAMYQLGLINSAGLNGAKINKKAAFYWYSQAALAGFAGAQNNLGDLYERGEGVTQSFPEAIYWYTQSAMQGEPTAYLSLGEMFYKGLGVNANQHRAAFWLTLAFQNLPDGNNKKSAENLLNIIIKKLSAEEKDSIFWKATTFKPLKQTEYTLGDSPYQSN